jgi:hypothetical protein
MSSSQAAPIHYRSLTPIEGHSPHFLAALQVVAHVISPLRKALVHFYFLTNKETAAVEKKIEWVTLRALGRLIKELIAAPVNNDGEGSKQGDDKEESDDEDEPGVPVNPTEIYKALEPTLKHYEKTTEPKHATEALQILLDIIQKSARTLPLTSHLWVALLDLAGMGLMGKQTIVGKCPLLDDDEILQRTQKETILEWCPLVLRKKDSLEEALKEHCARKLHAYDFDKKPYQFEVRIPLLSPQQLEEDDMDPSSWKTTKSVLYTKLTSYLFLGIDRLNSETGNFDETEMEIPKLLDFKKYCEKTIKGATEYELIGGLLHDEDDYVALLKNPNVDDPEDEDAWMLMESEEIIPMTESDALDFLKGEDEGAPCGTLVVYRLCDNGQPEMKRLLSDIIISQVSGSLDSAGEDFYYEEEVIED